MPRAIGPTCSGPTFWIYWPLCFRGLVFSPASYPLRKGLLGNYVIPWTTIGAYFLLKMLDAFWQP